MPENLNEMNEGEREYVMDLHRRRLVHYHYLKITEECNALHHAALRDPMGVLRRRLFDYAGDMWDGETLQLKVALIDATQNWQILPGEGVSCPIAFDNEDIQRTLALDQVQREVDETMEAIQNMVGFGSEGWVDNEHYEGAVKRSEKLKRDVLAGAESEEERTEILTHWILDDMDEGIYM